MRPDRGLPGLTVAASLTVAEHLLPGWLGELTRDQVVDVGFVESLHTLRGLRSRVVARDRLVLVVAPGHRWARRRRPVGAEELAGTPIVSRERGSGTRDTLERAVRRAGGTLVEPLLELGSSTAAALLGCALRTR